ncbi:MAG: hypothetical protein IKF01_04300 [Bacilli bacterium]|nr:hypothetical protein [Bacilli bacterium]
MTSRQDNIKDIILNGQDEVLKKRQLEVAPKIKKLIEDYTKISEDNKKIFDDYHNSFYSNKKSDSIPEIINYFSNGMNELELNEFDLDLIVDSSSNMTLLDFILKNKPDLSLNNFSLGGSYTEIGIKFLEKILLSGDKEYIKYLSQIGFTGSPELYLKDINGKKVIDYLIENNEEYRNFCGIEFNLKIKDTSVKEYLLNNIQNGKYNIINTDNSINMEVLLFILNTMDFNVEELFRQIELGPLKESIIIIYLSQDILKDKEKIKNVIIPKHILESLINKFILTKSEELKNNIRDFLNNVYVDEVNLNNIDQNLLDVLKSSNISLNIKEKESYNDEEDNFYSKLDQLTTILKTGIRTSDDVIKYILNNYINLYNLGLPFTLKEIETLILIKRNNPKFHIEDSNVGPNFDDDTIHLVLSDPSSLGYHGEDNYSVFNHEVTHAIQYYCYSDNTPRDYYNTLPDKSVIAESIARFSAEVISMMEKTLDSEEFQKSFPSLNDKNFEETKKRQMYYISTNTFGYEREVIDIFDTILCFTENLSKLGIKNADFIEGHPYDYMKYGGYDFSEMLADYKSVISSGRDNLIQFVKDNLSMECISFIENFYMGMLDSYIKLYKNQDIQILDEELHYMGYY